MCSCVFLCSDDAVFNELADFFVAIAEFGEDVGGVGAGFFADAAYAESFVVHEDGVRPLSHARFTDGDVDDHPARDRLGIFRGFFDGLRDFDAGIGDGEELLPFVGGASLDDFAEFFFVLRGGRSVLGPGAFPDEVREIGEKFRFERAHGEGFAVFGLVEIVEGTAV